MERLEEVVKLCNFAKLTAANIWKRSLEVKEERLAASLLPPKIKDLVSVKKKSGRPLVLLVNDIIEIFKACTFNKENCKKQQHHVAVEEGFKACRRTIKIQLRVRNLHQLKTIKKLALIDIQKV